MKYVIGIVAAAVLVITGLILNSDHRDRSVDVDLSALNNNMAYSELCYITERPKEYKGKTVKIKGEIAAFYDQNEKKNRYACVVGDAAGCCTQAMEFEPPAGETIPTSGEITLIGTYNTYPTGEGEGVILKNTRIAE